MKRISVQYYAILREQSAIEQEIVETQVEIVKELYQNLNQKYNFSLQLKYLRVSINNIFVSWDTPLQNGDKVVFISPVSGG